MAEARERLAGARDALAGDHAAFAASGAYYAMLYAARAALSERDLYAKTHSGTWNLFRQEIVAEAEFDPGLAAQARRTQRTRELGDYEAKPPSLEKTEEIVEVAERFIAEVERLFGDRS